MYYFLKTIEEMYNVYYNLRINSAKSIIIQILYLDKKF